MLAGLSATCEALEAEIEVGAFGAFDPETIK
jgi:hypothetical protein